MELVGHAFDLPMEDASIIDNALDVYGRWSVVGRRSSLVVRASLRRSCCWRSLMFVCRLFTARRPPPVSASEESFFQDIFQHMSLLFKPRKSTVGTCACE